jgi:hypothetical protein
MGLDNSSMVVQDACAGTELHGAFAACLGIIRMPTTIIHVASGNPAT